MESFVLKWSGWWLINICWIHMVIGSTQRCYTITIMMPFITMEIIITIIYIIIIMLGWCGQFARCWLYAIAAMWWYRCATIAPLIFVHTICGTKFAIRCIWRPYGIIALNASTFTVCRPKFCDACLRTEFLFATLCRQYILQNRFVLCTPCTDGRQWFLGWTSWSTILNRTIWIVVRIRIVAIWICSLCRGGRCQWCRCIWIV